MEWRCASTFILGMAVGLVMYSCDKSYGMDNMELSVPGTRHNGNVTVTLPGSFHPALQIQSVTIDKNGVVTGITLFHKIKGSWVLINQQIINDELYMTNDGVGYPYTKRTTIYEENREKK